MSSRARRVPAERPSASMALWEPAQAALPVPLQAGGEGGEERDESDAVDLVSVEAEAYARGLADGQSAAEQAMAAERARLQDTISDISALRRVVLARAERDLVTLAAAIARRILHREVRLDPHLVLALVHVALERLGPREAATVRLNPQDLLALAAPIESTQRDGLTFVPDPDVPVGGSRIESGLGEIDLSIDAQVGELSRMLLDDRPSA